MKRKQQIILMHLDGKSNREIAQDFHMSKDTVNKYVKEYEDQKRQLFNNDPSADTKELISAITEKPKYNTGKRTTRKVTNEIINEINYCLEINKKRIAQGMSKQKMLKKDIHNHLVKKGYDISYTTVKIEVNKIEGSNKEAFIRQEYEPGDACEFDWGVVKLDINGAGYKRYELAVFTSANSNYRYAKLFERQDTAAFQESHAEFFEYSKGSFHEMVYDNMRVAIRKFVGLTEKEPTAALLGLSLYYGFQFRFNNIYRANEKGHVERSVDVVRNNAFSMPDSDSFASLADANAYLKEQCRLMNNEKISNGTIPAEKFQIEQQRLLPCPPKFECCIRSDNRVDKYSTVIVKQSHYSVPDNLVGKMVGVKAYTDTIVIYHDGIVVAAHDRSSKRNGWVIDIMHYLRTLAKKPGALRRSSALLQADTQIKNLYDNYYTKDAKTFLQVLEIIKGRGVAPVMEAVRKLETISPADMSYDKILAICDCMREESSNIIFISDHLTELSKKSLSEYDMLFVVPQTSGGEIVEG